MECACAHAYGRGLRDGKMVEFKLNTVEEVLAYIAARNAMMTR